MRKKYVYVEPTPNMNKEIKPPKKKGKHRFLKGIGIFFLITIALSIIIPDTEEEKQETKNDTLSTISEESSDSETETEKTKTPKVVDMTKKFKEIGFNDSESKDLADKFKSVGIEQFVLLPGYVGTDINNLIAYSCYANGNQEQRFNFTIEHRKLLLITSYDVDLYDMENSNVHGNINNVAIPEREVNVGYVIVMRESASDIIKSKLNYPNTLKMGVDRSSRWNDDYTYTCEFTAKNAFGVESSGVINVTFKDNNGALEIVKSEVLFE